MRLINQMLLQPMLLICFSLAVGAYVYSCEEMKYRILNKSAPASAVEICLLTQEGFSNWEQLKSITIDGSSTYKTLYDMKDTKCISTEDRTPRAWTFSGPFGLDCDQEFTLIYKSDDSTQLLPLKQMTCGSLHNQRVVFTVPQTEMYFHTRSCSGSGVVTISTGAGNTNEHRYPLRSWTCSTLPNYIFSFENSISIEADASVTWEFEVTSYLGYYSRPVVVPTGSRIAVYSSGRSDNLQNFRGGTAMFTTDSGRWEPHRVYIETGEMNDVTVNMDLTFDSANPGYVTLQEFYGGTEVDYYNGTQSVHISTNYFEVRIHFTPIDASAVWDNQDNFLIDITIGVPVAAPTSSAICSNPTTTTKIASTTTQTTTISTTTTAKLPGTSVVPTPSAAKTNDPYCNCAVDKFGFPAGWDYNDVWLDIVVILDTSEAMGAEALDDAAVLIESLISDGVGDEYLITSTTAPFYSRVGVISMADTATVLYNLNMTAADKVQGKAAIKKGVQEIDVVAAFDVAVNMLDDGLISQPERANTRQVIYYLTDSEPKISLNGLNPFKAAKGAIIVNNFLQEGNAELPGLKELASDGYYFTDEDYMKSLQSFCKANCFCKPDKTAYGGSDAAIIAAGGCYHSSPSGVPFPKAKSACANEKGILAAVHDEAKGRFVQQQLSKASSDYYWIGYERDDDGTWTWEDQSTDPYTNWDVNEPSSMAVAKCAYVDKSNAALPWGAGNCQVGFPYVCQYAPCSVGYKDC